MLPNRRYHSLLSDCSSLTRVAGSSPTPFSSLDPSLPRLVRHWQAGCESSSCCGPGALLGAGGSCASPGIHKLLAYSVYILAPHVHRAPPHLLMRRPFTMPHAAACIPHSTCSFTTIRIITHNSAIIFPHNRILVFFCSGRLCSQLRAYGGPPTHVYHPGLGDMHRFADDFPKTL